MKSNIYLLKSVLLSLFLWLLSYSGMAQTITTDKDDYLPGEQAIISGAGWFPGETINFKVEHLVFTEHSDEFFNTTADEAGNIVDVNYFINPWDLGETFLLTATGQSSGNVAITNFTDATGSTNKVYQHWADQLNQAGGPAWQGDILNAGKSDYFEGEVIPHVFVFKASNQTPLTNGTSYSFNVTYNYYQANTNAGGFAYMTTFNISRTPGPNDATNPYVVPTLDGTFTNGGGTQGVFYTVDANITNVSNVSYTGTGTKDGHVTITFIYTGITTTNGIAEIYYGLYIAEPAQVPDQGLGPTTGASAWTGGSLQTTVDINGSGATSIQLSPDAIIRGEISGTKYGDVNGNGTKDNGEVGLAGWTIYLDLNNNGTLDQNEPTDVTDASGSFFFSVLPDADRSDADNDPYYVREVENQTGYTRTQPSTGVYGPILITIADPTEKGLLFGNYYCVPPDLNDASLALCATAGATTAIFDLTTAETGVDIETMTIVYSDANETITTPSAYEASNNDTVTVTAYFDNSDAACTETATITLTVYPEPTAVASNSGPVCNEALQVTLNETGGEAVTWAWTSDGSAVITNTDDKNPTVTGFVNGEIFTVEITDANGCISTATTSVFVNPEITASAVPTHPLCFNEKGSIELTVSGGTPFDPPAEAYFYAWTKDGSAYATTEDLSNLSVGIYDVTVTDKIGCTTTASTTINAAPALLTITATPTQPLCYGETGSVLLEVSGGTPDYILDPDNPPIAGLGAGFYTYNVTDANGCTASATVTILEAPTLLTITATPTQPLCYGETGSVLLEVSGGTPEYMLDLDNPPIAGLGAGFYTYNVTDANGCTASVNVTILEAPTLLTITATPTQPLCYGETGSVVLEVSGGTPEYMLDLDNPPIAGLGAGFYTYNVTDANGCTASVNVTILEAPTLLTITATPTQPLCYGETGSVVLEVSGGTPEYMLDLDNPPIAGLGAGFYTYNVTDANGCTASANVTILEAPALLTITATPTQPLCYGETGSVVLEVSGGTPEYTYDTDNPETTGLEAGDYTYNVTDANGCTASATVTILEAPTLLTITATPTQPLCYGETGSVLLEVSGGTPEYMLDLDNPPIAGLGAGFYTYNVTDANGCTASANVTILEAPALLTITATPTQPLCYGETGSVVLEVSGGTPEYTYDTDNPETTGLEAGDYTYNVTDANGCTASANITIVSTTQILVSITADVDCELGKAGIPSGTVTVIGSGYATLQLWSAGADKTVGGGDDSQIGNDVSTSASSYDFGDLYSGSYYVIALAPNTAGVADACSATSNVDVVDECYWFNIAKVTQGLVDKTKDWRFTVYEGPDGFGKTSVASATTLNDDDGILNFGNVNLDPDKTYTICEEQMAAGWSAIWITDLNGVQTVLMTYNPNGDENPPQDLGNRCFDIGAGTAYSLYSNDIFTIHVDNTYPGGTARTPGYWKNWNSCTGGGQAANAARNGGWQEGYWLLDDVLNSPGVTLGSFKIPAAKDVPSGCPIAVNILDQRDIKTLKKNSSDAAYTLAMHLLAFKLNQAAGAYSCPYAIDAAAKADKLLAGLTPKSYDATGTYLNSKAKNYAYALSLAKILDDYNNNRLSATDCAKTVKSAELAEIEVPAPTFESTFRAYPNPFTEKLNIEFSSATNTQVRLEIYSITGARLEVLFNGPVNAGELYTVEYLPKLVSSQIVFYHLTMNGTTQVGKLIYNERR